MERSNTPETRATNDQAFAALGMNETVYIRELEVDKVRAELQQSLPAGVDFTIDEGARLFGLFAADGTRIAIADSREAAMLAARQSQMTPVSVH